MTGNSLTYYVIKIVVTTVLIVAISEISKRSTLAGAVLASIPLVSVLAMIWLYIETNDVNRASTLATSVFWLILPSLMLFVTFPLLVKNGLPFYPSIGLSIGITVCSYFLMVAVLKHYGVAL